MTALNWEELWAEGSNGAEWSHSGIAVDGEGRVIFAAPEGGALVFHQPDTGETVSHAVPLMEIHGIFHEAGDGLGTDHLWLADPGTKARPGQDYDLEVAQGNAVRMGLGSGEFTHYAAPEIYATEQLSWRPTSVIAATDAEGREIVWVADGYGASLVHRYVDGILAGPTLDGTEAGARFRQPHGLALDTREDTPVLVVADRSNKRLVFYTLEGEFLRELRDPLFTSPSSIAVRGEELVVTELAGALLAVDLDDRVRALVSLSDKARTAAWPNDGVTGSLCKPDMHLGELNSPHGVAIDAQGRILLTEWVIGGRQLRLTLP